MSKQFTVLMRVLAIGALAVFAGHAAAQQAYPSRQIRIIVPFPPGGTNNTIARILAQKMTENWGQQVLVDNRPGGNTIIGSEALLKSAPDGYTVMVTSNTHVITPLLIPTPFDSIRDFAPVATAARSENVLVIHPSLPANTVREFIALAKSRPGQLNYASSAAGSPTHLAAALFEILTGVKMQHVPYKGGGPGLIDLISGQVQVYFNTPISFIPHIKSGRLKILAVTGNARLSALPQAPTFAEAGLPEFDIKTWIAVLAPLNTPREIIDRLSAEVARIQATPDYRERLDSLGMAPLISAPDQLAALMRSETVALSKVIKTANIKIEH